MCRDRGRWFYSKFMNSARFPFCITYTFQMNMAHNVALCHTFNQYMWIDTHLYFTLHSYMLGLY